MSIRPIRPEVSGESALSRTMLDRVIARVNDVGSSTPQREARSLRLVFDDLGTAYRRYRKETGAPISAVVREAARRFRKEPSVLSLASVAGRLDELKILDW